MSCDLSVRRKIINMLILLMMVFSTFISSPATAIKLEEEFCMPRRVVVPIDAPIYSYRPSMVSVYRCSGADETVSPALKTCVKNSSEELNLEVSYAYDSSSHFNYKLENHTSCVGKCIRNESSCFNTQKWDSENCKCTCKNETDFKCPKNYKWNPSLCQCDCNIECPNRKKGMNKDECSCTCYTYFYKKCSRNEQFLSEEDCSCISPKPQIGLQDCNIVPTKWAVIVIVLSFTAFFVLAFDCILYSRHKSGCIHHVTHICSKPATKPPPDEKSPMYRKGQNQSYRVDV